MNDQTCLSRVQDNYFKDKFSAPKKGHKRTLAPGNEGDIGRQCLRERGALPAEIQSGINAPSAIPDLLVDKSILRSVRKLIIFE